MVFPGRSDVTLAKMNNPLFVSEDRLEVELPRLRIVVERERGEATHREIVHDGDLLRVGSHASNDLVLDDPTISRFHCRITREQGGWRIADTDSKNGLRVGGVRVLSAVLEDEATLTLGDSMLRVRADGAGEGVSVPAEPSFGGLLGASGPMRRLFAMLERLAAVDIDVLVLGESGTGKELIASELVQRSGRSNDPLVVVDCGAISPSLVESELFGHVRGAFTGADRDREGAFEAADGGTVFLDEIGELPLDLQPKLLRALEAREVRRVGQTKPRRVDVRVIAATHRDLEREVNRGRFREDLYYRLAKVTVRVPPLRERLEDVPALVRHFAARLAGANGERLFNRAAMDELCRYDWPGNVRELRNYVERSVALDDAPPPSMKSGVMPAFRDTAEGEGAGAGAGAGAGGAGRSVPAPAGTFATSPPPASGAAGGAGAESAESAAGSAGSLPPPDRSVPFRIAKERAIEAFEKAYIAPLLDECAGNMSKAARQAQMDRMYLHQLAQKHGFRTGRGNGS